VGDFPAQINYWGDVRVIFDYLFPDVLPGKPTEIPAELIEDWEDVYVPAITELLDGSPVRRNQLMEIARIPKSAVDQQANIEAIIDVLWYNVFGTNDGVAKLGGNPYSNRGRWYSGSPNDLELNLTVERFDADQAALDDMQNFYQTSGELTNPIVMMHTTDPVIPFWHEIVYGFEVARAEAQGVHTSLPFLGRYGHCNFSTAQLVVAFVIVEFQVTGDILSNPERVLNTAAERQEFRDLMESYPLPINDDIEMHTLLIPSLPNQTP
jgi:hypothetical protein